MHMEVYGRGIHTVKTTGEKLEWLFSQLLGRRNTGLLSNSNALSQYLSTNTGMHLKIPERPWPFMTDSSPRKSRPEPVHPSLGSENLNLVLSLLLETIVRYCHPFLGQTYSWPRQIISESNYDPQQKNSLALSLNVTWEKVEKRREDAKFQLLYLLSFCLFPDCSFKGNTWWWWKAKCHWAASQTRHDFMAVCSTKISPSLVPMQRKGMV